MNESFVSCLLEMEGNAGREGRPFFRYVGSRKEEVSKPGRRGTPSRIKAIIEVPFQKGLPIVKNDVQFQVGSILSESE